MNSTTESTPLVDDLLDVVAFSEQFHFFAVLSCFIASLLGTVCNIFLLIKFATLKEISNGFQKICLVKTIPNIIICICFLLWVVPLTAFDYNHDDVPYWLNKLVGSMSGAWAYLLTPLLQVSMSCNRFYALYFPFGIKSVVRIPMIKIYMAVAIALVSTVTLFTFSNGCGIVFYPEYFQWFLDTGACAEPFAAILTYTIIALTITSNVFNVAIGSRLIMRKLVGVNDKDSLKRRRRWMIMFLQSVIQDSLHLIDNINANFMWKLSNELWFQFFFLTLSFVVISMLDGFVMLIFNREFIPKWCKNPIRSQSRVMAVTSRQPITTTLSG